MIDVSTAAGGDADVRHLLDLLELLPWQEIDDGDLWLIDNNTRLNAALDTQRWSSLAEASSEYRHVRDHAQGGCEPTRVGPAQRDAVEWERVGRLCRCLLDVFDGDDPELFGVLGMMLRATLSLQMPGEALGRRWCVDLAATAWAIAVPLAAEDRRRHRVN